MKIGLFTDTYKPEINGVVTSITLLTEGLRALGHDVWIIAPSHPDAPADEDQVIRVPSMPLVVLPERRFATPVEKGLMKQIKDLQLDVIHTNAEFAVNSFGFRAHKRYGIPLVHTYHTVWEDYTHYVVPSAFNRPARAAVRKLSVQVCDRADRVIAPTADTKNLLQSYGVSVPIDVIPTGVDLARFAPTDAGNSEQAAQLQALRKQWKLEGFSRTLLSIGRVASEKGVLELLLELSPYLKEHPETCLLVVGDGPQRRELQRLVPSLGIEQQVIFTGEQPWESVPDYYRLADVLVGNSVSETQGLTFIEAIASGTPIIARNNDCFKGIIEDGISGTLLEDETGFVPAIKALFEDEQFFERRVTNGFEAATHISKEVFAEAVEQSYIDTVISTKMS